jgi:hypothetical protein
MHASGRPPGVWPPRAWGIDDVVERPSDTTQLLANPEPAGHAEAVMTAARRRKTALTRTREISLEAITRRAATLAKRGRA